ncbi:MAG: hypothetical protein U5J98_01590 [Halobacteriales archaeon]|nr:hypothetical protein [Halobacteriales archaeon]
MSDDGIDHEALYDTVRRASRDGFREALWDVFTVVIVLLLLALGVPLLFASAGGSGPAAWLGALVGLLLVAMAGYRLYDRFWRESTRD